MRRAQAVERLLVTLRQSGPCGALLSVEVGGLLTSVVQGEDRGVIRSRHGNSPSTAVASIAIRSDDPNRHGDPTPVKTTNGTPRTGSNTRSHRVLSQLLTNHARTCTTVTPTLGSWLSQRAGFFYSAWGSDRTCLSPPVTERQPERTGV